MANIQVIQRNAHLAGDVKCEQVASRNGPVTKGTLVAISNSHRGSGDSREVQATSITWTLWGKQAESLQEYLTKGKQIYVEGRLQTRQWDDKDGNKRYTTEIKADRITLLGGGGGGGRGAGAMERGAPSMGGGDEPPVEPITDDDIPF